MIGLDNPLAVSTHSMPAVTMTQFTCFLNKTKMPFCVRASETLISTKIMKLRCLSLPAAKVDLINLLVCELSFSSLQSRARSLIVEFSCALSYCIGTKNFYIIRLFKEDIHY